MSQLALELNGGSDHRIQWARYGRGLYSFADYEMIVGGRESGVFIRHCGHPTAIRPYYVELHNGVTLERKFSHLKDAKAAALAALKEA